LINSHSPEGFFIGLPFTIQLTPEAKRNLANYIDKEYVVEFYQRQSHQKPKVHDRVESFESPSSNALNCKAAHEKRK
jgi:hypothetical protein